MTDKGSGGGGCLGGRGRSWRLDQGGAVKSLDSIESVRLLIGWCGCERQVKDSPGEFGLSH